MMAWYFIKWLAENTWRLICAAALAIGRFIIGWFCLGRSCSRCKHYNLKKNMQLAQEYGLDKSFVEACCDLDFREEGACECSITKKKFERRKEWYE